MENKINISLMATLLGAKRASDSAYISKCPNQMHEDNNPSFVFKENKSSPFGVQYQCLSGKCTSEELTKALIDKGLIFFDKKEREYNPVPKKFNEDTLSEYYEYKDKEGKTIGFVGRYLNKDRKKQIIPFFGKPDEEWKTWRCGINKFFKKGEFPLYNLNRIVKSNEVWFVEGEKAANALTSIGITATTNQGGSSAISKCDLTPLINKNVVIWRDYDDAGAKHEFILTDMLKSLDIKFKVVDTIDMANKVAEIKGE